MAKASLLKAACAAAMLAATPVLAQTSTNMDDPATTDQSAAPATQGRTSGYSGSHHRSTHRSTMHQRGSGGGDSQNAEVDRLNQQSYEAAQRGQTFGSTGSSSMSTSPGGSGSMSTSPGGSGSMNDMSGGSMSNEGTMGGSPSTTPSSGTGGGRM